MTDTFDIAIHKVASSRLNEVDFNNIPFGKTYSDHMFVADFFDGDWRDFRIIPFGPLHLSPASVTLHYGHSVFEGMKAYKNKKGEVFLFRPLENHKRLNISARRMCIKEVPQDVFIRGIQELLSIDKDWIPGLENTSLYVRPIVFATDEYIGIKPSSRFKFIIITCPVGSYYSRPVKVKIESKYSRAAPGGTGFAKTAGNYGGSLYPATLAHEEGYDQLLWTDAASHQYIEESGTMNIMFLKRDTLFTPPAGDTILKGITRDSILTLAKDMGIEVVEKQISVKEVIEWIESGELQEAFGTGTAAVVTPISNIGFQEADYELSSQRTVAEKLKSTLVSIKTGQSKDRYGWTMQV